MVCERALQELQEWLEAQHSFLAAVEAPRWLSKPAELGLPFRHKSHILPKVPASIPKRAEAAMANVGDGGMRGNFLFPTIHRKRLGKSRTNSNTLRTNPLSPEEGEGVPLFAVDARHHRVLLQDRNVLPAEVYSMHRSEWRVGEL
jgi:hypothetical protein